jgi:glycosyltransferase involved in cell wall biosynthesis
MSAPWSAQSMLEGQSIICFAHDWDGDPTSKTHIMRILARRNRVLWVNSIGMRRPRASGADVRRLASKLRRGLGPSREVEPNLFVVNPLALPLPGVAIADWLNTALIGATLRRRSRAHGIERPILWTFLPTIHRLLGRLGERLVVYHCVDEYSAFSGVSRAAVERMERELVRRADVVLTSSQQLADERRPFNSNTHCVQHGVDVAHFARAADPSTEIPADLRGLPRPVVGFHGLLADWVDLDLVRKLADARPAWSFVLIGKPACDLGAIAGAANVHLLGRKPYGTLPAYCKGFDAAIIPFRIDALTLRANPLKMREYLAAGLPVVSTPLPEVARYRHLLHQALAPADFLAALERALEERSQADVRRRMEAMRSESWEARTEEMCDLLQQRLRAAA